VSNTVTAKLQECPEPSEQFTVVVPIGKTDPDDGVQVIVAPHEGPLLVAGG